MKRSRITTLKLLFSLTTLIVFGGSAMLVGSASAQTFAEVSTATQPKIAKIYGAGGIRGLEAYQSGVVISAHGHILTAFSYVLDTDDVSVTLHDGREFTATMVGADPKLELALLKIDATELAHFDLKNTAKLTPGDRVLAFSNLYGIAAGNEPVSVLHGSVAGVTKMAGRRGAFNTPYQGPIYVLDAITNNAGAAGGALTDRQGRLAGIIGKELRSSETNIWLNFAMPMDAIGESVTAMKNGTPLPDALTESESALAKSPWTDQAMGIRMVPNLLIKTPPFIESVVSDSPGDAAGLKSDDLIMYVGTVMIRSWRDLAGELKKIEDQDDLQITVLRDRELVPVTLEPATGDK